MKCASNAGNVYVEFMSSVSEIFDVMRPRVFVPRLCDDASINVTNCLCLNGTNVRVFQCDT